MKILYENKKKRKLAIFDSIQLKFFKFSKSKDKKKVFKDKKVFGIFLKQF